MTGRDVQKAGLAMFGLGCFMLTGFPILLLLLGMLLSALGVI